MTHIEYGETIKQWRDSRNLKDKQDINYVNARISEMVKLARIDKGITQSQLAKMIGTKQPSIARLESGKTPPSISFLNDIAKALDTYLIEPRFESIAHYYYDEYIKTKEESLTPAFASGTIEFNRSYYSESQFPNATLNFSI